MVLGILQGTVKLPGAAGDLTVDSVPRAIFNSHAAEMERSVAVLRQDIVGWGYNTIDWDFNVLEDYVMFY